MGSMGFSPYPENTSYDKDLYRQISDLVRDNFGLYFAENNHFFLEKRLEARRKVLQLPDIRDYYYYLLYDPAREKELSELVQILTTNETYFMREMRQLTCFQKDALPILKRRAEKRKIRIWSAGCSSGEEPYSIAILIYESGIVSLDDVEILATDINSKVVAKAKAGIYGPNSFRNCPYGFQDKYFQKVQESGWEVRKDLREHVTFNVFNLFKESSYSFLAPFDLIFCRNVIIYFDLEAKCKVLNKFYEKLREGGFLLLGHSESLISITDKFFLTHFEHDMVYVRS